MGIWEQLQHANTTFNEIAFINERHKRIGSIHLQALREAFNLDVVEVWHSGLARVLYELTKDEVEYCFGDSIQSVSVDHSLQHLKRASEREYRQAQKERSF